MNRLALQSGAVFLRRGPDVTERDGLGVSASLYLTAGELSDMKDNRALKAALNRILKNIGSLGVRRVQRIIDRFDAIDTGRFRAAWKQKRLKDGADFNTAVVLTNRVRDRDTGKGYARYVHPKRTPKSRTIVSTDLPEVVMEMGKELANDLDVILRPKLAKALKAAILKRAAEERRRSRRR